MRLISSHGNCFREARYCQQRPQERARQEGSSRGSRLVPPSPECFHAPEAEGGDQAGLADASDSRPSSSSPTFSKQSGALGCGVVRVWGAYFPRHPRFPLPSLGGRCGPRGNQPGWGSDAWRSVRFSRGFPVDRADAATRANESVGAAATPDQPTRWRWKADRDCRSCVKRAISVAHPQPSPCTSTGSTWPAVP